MPRSARPTRDKIVAAAAKLFYLEGVRAVSVDAVAAAAGVTKRTLYYHFKSKDDLVAAYLESRDQPTLAQFQRWFADCDGGLAEKVRAIFLGFAEAAAGPRWRGCGFLRTTAELANLPGHPALAAGARHKKRFETWLAGELTEGGIAEPETTARRILVLLDGAAAVMLVHRDPSYGETAGDLAASLISANATP